MADTVTAFPGYSNPDCSKCGGTGLIEWIEQYTDLEHGCDGTPEMCDITCPVPVATQRQMQDYCECIRDTEY